MQLSWNIGDSVVISEEQRTLLLSRLANRLAAGAVTVAASEQRSQLRNREIALVRLAEILAAGLAPYAPPRRETKVTRGAHQRRLAAKGERSATKQQRRPPAAE